jgi:endonuclease G
MQYRLYLTILACALITACGDSDSIIEGSIIPPSSGNDAPPPSEGVSTHAYTKLIEVPQLKQGNTFVYHAVKVGADSIMNFCLEYDREKYHSRWVAFRFDGNTRAKSVARKDYNIKPQYPRDPKLNSSWALENDALYGSGYNHGHLVASADRLYSREANDQTFYMSNMSPQIGNFNSGFWADFEQNIQSLGRDKNFCDTLYVCKGGTIDRSEHIIKYVADGRMAVPKYYFMAAVAVKNGTYKGIAFWMEHKTYSSSESAPDKMRKYALSIDALEEKTGINFFHNLPEKVETVVEANYNANVWIY